MEYLINVADIEKGGHLFYRVMMTFITFNTEEASCTLTLKGLTFKITSIQEKTLALQSVNYEELI